MDRLIAILKVLASAIALGTAVFKFMTKTPSNARNKNDRQR